MTIAPRDFANYTEGFNYSTITNGSTDADLTDSTINSNVVDSIVSTSDGRFRPYINGRMKFDSGSTYYLSSDETKSGSMLTYIPHSSSASAPTQPLNTWNPYPVVPLWNSNWLSNDQENLYRPVRPHALPVVEKYQGGNMVSTTNIRPGLGDQSEADAEGIAINNSFNTAGHNSYSYQVNLHPEFTDDILSVGSGPGVAPFHAGTGIYTTRVYDMPVAGGVTNQISHNTWPKPKSSYPTYSTSNAPDQSWVGYPMNASHRGGLGGPWYYYHNSTSFMVRLKESLDPGEYIPICMYDVIDTDVKSIDDVSTDSLYPKTNPKTFTTAQQAAAIAAETGTSTSSYDQEFLQWYFLTMNTRTKNRRKVHDMIVFIGKPYHDNPNGDYELVVYAAGGETSSWITGTPESDIGFSTPYPSGMSKKATYYAGCTSLKKRIPVDDLFPGNGEPGFVPVFLHASIWPFRQPVGCSMGSYGSSNHQPFGSITYAIGSAIQDYTPAGNLRSTSMGEGNIGYNLNHHSSRATDGSSLAYNDDGVSYYNRCGQGADDNPGSFWTYCATDKTDITSINYNILNGVKADGSVNVSSYGTHDGERTIPVGAIVPTKTGDWLDYPQHYCFFPHTTLSYEAVGGPGPNNQLESTLTDLPDAWNDEENILTVDLDQAASLVATGEDNGLKVGLKLCTDNNVQDNYIVKSLLVDVRGIKKRFINPGLAINFALYDNSTDPGTRLTAVTQFAASSSEPVNRQLDIRSKTNGDDLTYGDIKDAYLLIWAD